MSARSLVMSALGLVAVAVAGPASAIEASGQAVAVLRDTRASGPGGERVLQAKAPIYTGDAINTNRRGIAQLLFADDTRMVVGPNSQVTIDDFVFAGTSTASTFTVDALRGSFRFITGTSAKNAYVINTPTATIGVRGTAFDGSVAEDGTTTIVLWHGKVSVCDKAGHCVLISGACSVIQLDPVTGLSRINDVYARTDLVDSTVPFAFRQARLNVEFRVASRGCEIHNTDPPKREQSPDAPIAPTPAAPEPEPT